ncbi:hypothetical protein RRG08_031410 [Elysia crispata]|uniref:Uncharacterized protein n=1 Tax=Elysia crispata TaxID=231223 RepID=A0AAE0ZP17_9GAST|nr:hypothetical protein RRG08_031410 [Elysia crispata]
MTGFGLRSGMAVGRMRRNTSRDASTNVAAGQMRNIRPFVLEIYRTYQAQWTENLNEHLRELSQENTNHTSSISAALRKEQWTEQGRPNPSHFLGSLGRDGPVAEVQGTDCRSERSINQPSRTDNGDSIYGRTDCRSERSINQPSRTDNGGSIDQSTSHLGQTMGTVFMVELIVEAKDQSTSHLGQTMGTV